MLPFAAAELVALMRTGGAFEYALDDVYIHLAMSEGIAAGGYGVNPGEYASASSSILWPFLLAPFAGFDWHRYVPLALNAAALAGAALLWGALVRQVVAPLAVALALSLAGPVFLGLPGVAFLGMEHAAQVCASLAVTLGLIRFLDQGTVGLLLWLGVLAAPLLRHECLSVALMAAGIVTLCGSWRRGLLLGLAATGPALGFSLWLLGLGLSALPGSMLAKSVLLGSAGSATEAERAGLLVNLLVHKFLNGMSLSLAVAAYLCLLVAALVARPRPRAVVLLGLGLPAAVAAQVLLSLGVNSGRYDAYLWVFLCGMLLWLCRSQMAGGGTAARLVGLGLFLGLIFGGLPLVRGMVVSALDGPAAILGQQAEMGRFVDGFWQAPVAVNDLGHVSYRNDLPVLDLWGLGSPAALAARLGPDRDNWAGRLAAAGAVDAAMVYRGWIPEPARPGWTEVARLHLTVRQGNAAAREVAVFATRPEAVPRLRAALAAFAPTLSPLATLEIMP